MTWLYGPLQTVSDKPFGMNSGSGNSNSPIFKSSSFLRKKPILKKQSMSETIRRKSQLSSSLVKRAAAGVQAQQSDRFDRPCLGWPGTTHMSFVSTPSNSHNPSLISSISTSGSQSPRSPGPERKYIQFNEEVKQCIALCMKELDKAAESQDTAYNNESDHNDSYIMMKRINSARKLLPVHRSTTQPCSAHNDGNTIAILPSTTLKHCDGTLEPHEITVKHSNGFCGSQSPPSPSDDRPERRLSEGLSGKIVDTVNTAEDIMYVLWNVGWRG